MKDKKLRIEDALAATKAAVSEGIVPGGGSSYLCALDSLKSLITLLSGDEKIGAEIIYNAIQEPIKQIAINAGVDSEEIIFADNSLRLAVKRKTFANVNAYRHFSFGRFARRLTFYFARRLTIRLTYRNAFGNTFRRS